MNIAALKGKIKSQSMVQNDVAEGIGISLSRFNAKLNGKGGAEFTLGEIISLRKLLGISAEETEVIFFR